MVLFTLITSSFSTVISLFITNKRTNDSETITLEYSFCKPIVEKIFENGEVSTQISLDDCDFLIEENAPILPKKTLKILLPPFSFIKSINVKTINEKKIENIENLQFSSDIYYPLSDPELSLNIIDKEKNLVEFKGKNLSSIDNKKLLKQYEKYPYSSYSISNLQYKNGFPILIMDIYPVQYEQKTNNIIYHEKIIVKIITQKDESIKMHSLFRNNNRDFNNIENIVNNPSMLCSYSTLQKEKNIFSTSNNPIGNMLIITTEDLKNTPKPYNLDELADKHRNLQGMKVFIETVENIYEKYESTFKPRWWWEDHNGWIIRECVKDYYKNKDVDYVLLVGADDYQYKKGAAYNSYYARLLRDGNIADENEVPTFQLYLYTLVNHYVIRDPEFPRDPNRFKLIVEIDNMTTCSDLPYACLDDFSEGDEYLYPDLTKDPCWEYYYNWTDCPELFKDLFAETYVGRAPVANSSELRNFVKKTISYMTAEPNDYCKVILAGEYLGGGGASEYAADSLDELVGKCNNHFQSQGIPNKYIQDSDKPAYKIIKLYEKDKDWTGTNIVNKINKGKINYINHLGHSNIIINMKLAVPGFMDSDMIDENKKDILKNITDLKNNQYFIAYSQGCYSGAYDAGAPHYNDSIAEWLTVNTNNAGVACIANSHFGWGLYKSTYGPSQRYNREFLDAIFNEGKTRLGVANQDSKEDNFDRIDILPMIWLYYCINLIGDPALEFKFTQDYNPDDDPDDGDDRNKNDNFDKNFLFSRILGFLREKIIKIKKLTDPFNS